jgi:predicted metalloprotease with PDZ domain
MKKTRSVTKSAKAEAAVRYSIVPIDPKGHLFEVTCEVAEPEAGGQRFSLPAWIPGSYMIREFARHIVSIEATSAGRAIELRKRDKHSWQAEPCDGPVRLRYRVYAWDPSVRAAHLDETHGFFNGTSVFLRVAGHEDRPHEVDLHAPPGRTYRAWRVATTLPELSAARHGFGTYRAANYDALIDHPVEMGTFRLERFDAAGVPHEIAYTGVIPHLDAARINADVAKICAAQIRFFGTLTSSGRKPRVEAPFERYVFLTAVAGEGYGGLEHRSSTALLASRDALPVEGRGSREADAAYLTFLGLVSHEYFHAWNVKRIKPAAFAPYDLAQENYTSLLWIFEGFTSYYDDLFLIRTGLASERQYLGMLAKTIDDVLAGAGRLTQSVAESSFDAWVKYYRQDENTPNAVVSYYKKGSLVALCLDLHIRIQSRGRASLDDAMRLLWTRYGRGFYAGEGKGLAEDAFPDLVLEATRVDVSAAVDRWAYRTGELPLAELLAGVGLELRRETSPPTAALGAKLAVSGSDTRLATVFSGGAAHEAGLSGGDTLIAIDGLRVMPGRAATLVSRYRPGDAVDVTVFRNDLLMTRRLIFGSTQAGVVIEPSAKPAKRAARLREEWLGGDAEPSSAPTQDR